MLRLPSNCWSQSLSVSGFFAQFESSLPCAMVKRPNRDSYTAFPVKHILLHGERLLEGLWTENRRLQSCKEAQALAQVSVQTDMIWHKKLLQNHFLKILSNCWRKKYPFGLLLRKSIKFFTQYLILNLRKKKRFSCTFWRLFFCRPEKSKFSRIHSPTSDALKNWLNKKKSSVYYV